jgi:lipopolysaccharide biosynthesis glycosyltransferase
VINSSISRIIAEIAISFNALFFILEIKHSELEQCRESTTTIITSKHKDEITTSSDQDVLYHINQAQLLHM